MTNTRSITQKDLKIYAKRGLSLSQVAEKTQPKP